MKRLCTATIVAFVVSVAAAGTAGAHSAPPCNDSGEPGNSDYAQHHIVVLAHDGMLGNPNVEGAHVPGSHRGFSLCIGE